MTVTIICAVHLEGTPILRCWQFIFVFQTSDDLEQAGKLQTAGKFHSLKSTGPWRDELLVINKDIQKFFILRAAADN
jgi:hypothetical protein